MHFSYCRCRTDSHPATSATEKTQAVRTLILSLTLPFHISETSPKPLLRRCFIIACTLEKRRLKHGAVTSSLDLVKDDLKLFDLSGSARPQRSVSYPLCSARPDPKDDGGVSDKD